MMCLYINMFENAYYICADHMLSYICKQARRVCTSTCSINETKNILLSNLAKQQKKDEWKLFFIINICLW